MEWDAPKIPKAAIWQATLRNWVRHSTQRRGRGHWGRGSGIRLAFRKTPASPNGNHTWGELESLRERLRRLALESDTWLRSLLTR